MASILPTRSLVAVVAVVLFGTPAQATTYLTVNDVSRSLGAPVVPFDLVVLSSGLAVPEPATLVLSVLGLLGMGFVTWHIPRRIII